VDLSCISCKFSLPTKSSKMWLENREKPLSTTLLDLLERGFRRVDLDDQRAGAMSDDEEQEAQVRGGERERWAAEMRDKKHSGGTKSAYDGKMYNLSTFLAEDYPTVLTEAYLADYRAKHGEDPSDKALRAWVLDRVHAVVKDKPETFMLNTPLVTDNVLAVWLAGFKAKDGVSPPSKSVYTGAISALSAL